MRDLNCSFAALFDKSIPLDSDLPKYEIEELVKNHKVKYPREPENVVVSKRKFSDYLKELGMPKWEIEIFRELRNVQGWYQLPVENLATFFITQSVIAICPSFIVIITNATFLGIFPERDSNHIQSVEIER
jgi:hypothetical protein